MAEPKKPAGRWGALWAFVQPIPARGPARDPHERGRMYAPAVWIRASESSPRRALGWICSLALLVLTTACTKSEAETKPLPALDGAAASEALDAVKSAAPEGQAVVAALVFADLERARVPDPLLDGLTAWVESSAGPGLAVVAPALSRSRDALDASCKGENGTQMLKSMAEDGGADAPGTVYDGCQWARLDLVSREEFTAAPGIGLLALVSLAFLENHGGAAESERRLLRTMVVGGA